MPHCHHCLNSAFCLLICVKYLLWLTSQGWPVAVSQQSIFVFFPKNHPWCPLCLSRLCNQVRVLELLQQRNTAGWLQRQRRALCVSVSKALSPYKDTHHHGLRAHPLNVTSFDELITHVTNLFPYESYTLGSGRDTVHHTVACPICALMSPVHTYHVSHLFLCLLPLKDCFTKHLLCKIYPFLLSSRRIWGF